jgi:hypothetical protein
MIQRLLDECAKQFVKKLTLLHVKLITTQSEGLAMQPDHIQASAERDQLWASLRQLRPEIEALAAAPAFTGSDRERQIIQLLSRIIISELDFRAEEGK